MSLKRILIVEDEAIVALDIKDRLEYFGYFVIAIIPNGEDAVKKALEEKPDIILMDIMLQGEIDGIQASEEINKFLDIPIVFLTANSDDSTLERARITGPFGYLLKPFEERELHTTIEMALYRHELELEVRENRLWLSTTLNSIGEAVIATDEHEDVVFMNSIAESLTGWSESKAKGKELKEVLNIINLDENTVLINKEGKHIPIDDSAAPIKNMMGEISGTVIVFRDITEKINAEQTLKRSEARYNEFLSLLREGIGVVNTEDILTYCNPAFAKIYGFDSCDEILGRGLLEFVPPDQKEMYCEQSKLRRKNISSQYELDILTKKGDRKTLLVSVTPRYDKENNFIGSLGGILDITDRKEAKIKLQDYQDHLEDLVRERTEKLSNTNKQLKLEIAEREEIEKRHSKTQEELEHAKRMELLAMLAGGVAHDLNNTLGPLVGYPELIISQLPSDSPLREPIKMMEDSAKQASHVIQDLLALARRGRYEMSLLNLNHVLESYFNSISFKKLSAQNPDIEIDLNFGDDVKNIRGSKTHLQKMVMNIVINAFEAIADSGILSIETSTEKIEKLVSSYIEVEPGEYITLRIKDTGMGIEPENINKIFEPFFSMKKMGRSGSGIGLSVVYGIIKDHKGYYDILSKVGEGTEFILYFPVSYDMQQISEVEFDNKGSESVLIIDDNQNQKDLAESLISSLGYEVNSVRSGRDAIRYLKNNPVDILLLDMILDDDFDGLDTYREIVKIYPNQKAIIVSGFSCTERIEKVQKLGAGEYVAKPFTRNSIGNALRTELDKIEVPVSI